MVFIGHETVNLMEGFEGEYNFCWVICQFGCCAVTCSTSIKDKTAQSVFYLLNQIQSSQTHIVMMIPTDDAVLTGGDDGRLKRTSINGEVEEIASFGTKWV